MSYPRIDLQAAVIANHRALLHCHSYTMHQLLAIIYFDCASEGSRLVQRDRMIASVPSTEEQAPAKVIASM